MFSRLVIFFALSFVLTTGAHSQSSNTYLNKKETSKKVLPVNKLLDSASLYMEKDPAKTFSFLEEAYFRSLESQNNTQQYQVLTTLGKYYQFYGQHDLAAANYKNSLKFVTNRDTIRNLVIKASQQYLKANEPDESLAMLEKYENHFSKHEINKYLETLGDTYFILNKPDSALNYFNKAIGRSSSNIESAKLNLKIAKVYQKQQDNDNEIKRLKIAQTLAEKSGDNDTQLAVSIELADYYKRNKGLSEEIALRNTIINQLSENSLNVKSRSNDPDYQKIREQVNLARIYNQKGRHSEAIKILGKNAPGTTNSENLELLELQKEAAKAKSEAYLKTGQKSKALETYEQYASILDRLYQKSEMKYENISSLNKQLRSQQNRIEFLEKDKTIYDAQMHALNQEKQTQKAQITYQQRYIILLAGGLLLLSLTVIMLISRNKIQRRHNAFLTLRSLRNQMNPHFIFNSLNSLNNFIVKKDEISANKYLSRFSSLMRSVLYHATDDFISLETEIDILKNYLELEKMRFRDKFSYILNVDSKVEVKRFNIPPMIIQPYIENAIWHGLRYKETKGNLSVDITMLGDMLKITIQDDGIGRKKSGAMKTKNQEKKKSSGIRATQKRLDELQKIYKKNIRYSISDLFENGEGTTVEILLPEININHE